jgi:hypothetical protein
MAMKPDVRQPATYRMGLRDALIIPQIYGDKVQQKHYLTKLELLLKRLHAQFIDPARRGEDELVLWPSDHDFHELDVCVLALARALRKKKLLTYAGTLKLVDQRWPRLHLARSVRSLLEEAKRLTPKSPAKPEPVEHMEWIWGLAEGNGRRADLARRFIKDHELLLAGKIELSKVRWADYEELLLGKGPKMIFLQCGMNFPNVANNCCVRYLETQRDYSLWNEKVNKWSEERTKCEPLYHWLWKRVPLDSWLNEARLDRKRRAARERQKRHRQKIRRKA